MKKIALFFLHEKVISVLLVVISFCVYLTTMCRSVGFTDSGELATVACTLGIAHPTGYPLFTLLGRCWAMIPVPLEEILWLNVFSAFLTAFAVGVFFKTTLALRQSTAVFQFRSQKRKETNDPRFIIASAIASLVLGFSTTFWSQSTAIEVYALHLVMVLLTIWTFIRGLENQLAEQKYISQKLILFAFVLGLSFSNHMTTILLAPGFLWLYFRTFGFTKASLIRIIRIAPFFLLGLSIYLYLPIRSSSSPLLDWGHPATVERFFWHISGKQFRVWMFSGWSVVQKQLSYYAENIFAEYHLAAIACIIAGGIYLWKQTRRLLVFLLILFSTTILYAVNYDIFDIGSYFLLSYLVLGWLAAFGIHFLLVWSTDKPAWIRTLLMVMLIAIPLGQIGYHWNNVDEAKNILPYEFVKESFANFEQNAVVFASQWDYFISPALYYQYIRNERRDITVIDKSLLQNRSWYFHQLQRSAPWLMERTLTSSNLFLLELNKFEHDLPFDLNIIQTHWQNLLMDFVEKSMPDHPIYIDARIDQEFSPVFQRTPSGLFLRLTKTRDTTVYRSACVSFSPWDKKNPVVNDFTKYYTTILTRDAYWLLLQGRKVQAKNILLEAQRIGAGDPTVQWLMRQVEEKK